MASGLSQVETEQSYSQAGMSFEYLRTKYQLVADDLNKQLSSNVFNVDVWMTGVTLEFEDSTFSYLYGKKVKLSYEGHTLLIVDELRTPMAKLVISNVKGACISNNTLYVLADQSHSYQINLNYTLIHITTSEKIDGYCQPGYSNTVLIHNRDLHTVNFYNDQFVLLRTTKYCIEPNHYMYIYYIDRQLAYIAATTHNGHERTVSASIADIDGLITKHVAV